MKNRLFAIFFGLFLALPASAERLNFTLQATKIVDLTQPMHEGMPYWPGGVPFVMERLVDYADGYQLHKFSMGENTGTHVDAPSHFIQGNRSIDQIPLNELAAPIAAIDIQAQVKDNPDYQLTAKDIADWELKNGKIPGGSLVLLNTGWHKRFSNPAAYINMDSEKRMHFPGYSPEAAKLLLTREIAGIGIDTMSLDYGQSKDFATHLLMLKANKYQIENMGNLDALPAVGATAVIGVLPVRGGSQAQARIFAFLP